MSYTIRDKTLALAGIFQAARLVQQVARSGMVDQEVFAASIKSVFKIDATSTEDVYSGAANVLSGCKTLVNQLGGGAANPNKKRDIEVTKYVITIMVLERKLAAQPQLLQKIASGIERAQSQAQHFSLQTHDNVIASLANVYSETISALKPRVMVNGEHNHLANPDNANKIRALLLAAMRSAVLWHQSGGSRWQVMFNRKSFVQEAENILKANPRTLH